MAQRARDLRFAAGLTAAYFCLAAVVVAHHEMWGDELQTWLLVRDSASLPELFRHLAYEGHPALWHLLLYALQHTVSTAPEAMQWLHLGIATATVAVVALAAPFTRLQRALFAFGYYPFYEYAAIARNYGIGLLFTVIACALVARRRPAPITTGVVLFLLAHTNVFGTIAAAALAAGLATEWLIERRRSSRAGDELKRDRMATRAMLWMVGLGMLGVVTAAWQMKPPPDYGFAIGWHVRPNADLFRLTLRIPAFTFLPLHPIGHDFWGRSVVGEHIWLKRIAVVLSLALLAWTARVAARRPAALVWYVLTVLGCLSFYYVKYLGTLRHYGMLVAAVVVAYWLAFASAEPSSPRRIPELRRASLVLTVVLALQAIAGVTAGWLDWRYNFSSAKLTTVAVGRPDFSGCVLAGLGTPTDVGVAAVLGYLPGRRRAYYVRTERFESFVIWDIRSRRRLSDSAVVARAKRLAAETQRGVLLLLPQALPPMPDAPRFFAAFLGSAVPEDFFLYIVRPPDGAAGSAAARCSAQDSSPGWSEGPKLPEPLQEMHAAVLHGKAYIAGGFQASNTVSTAVYRLDPSTGHWERMANLPAPRHHMPLAVVGDSLYAVGGLASQHFDAVATLWLYDEANNRWVARASLPEPRGASAAAVVGGRIIVVGGFGAGGALLDSIAIYDPAANRWHHGAPIPTRRDHLAAVAVDGKVYAIGGRELDPDKNLNRAEAYDPATNAWTAMAAMPTARGGLGAAAVGSQIHTFGGETRSSVFDEHEVYDVAANTWHSAPRMPFGRHGLGVAVLGNRIYIIGGGPRAGFAQTDAVQVFAP